MAIASPTNASTVHPASHGRSKCVACMLAHAAAGYGGRFLWPHQLMDERLIPLLEDGLSALGEADSALRVQLLSRLAAALRHQPSRERRVNIGNRTVRLG